MDNLKKDPFILDSIPDMINLLDCISKGKLEDPKWNATYVLDTIERNRNNHEDLEKWEWEEDIFGDILSLKSNKSGTVLLGDGYDGKTWIQMEEREQNLIKACPGMYRACKYLLSVMIGLDVFRNKGDEKGNYLRIEHSIKVLEKVLKLADGEQQ